MTALHPGSPPALALLLLTALVAAVCLGAVAVPPADVLAALRGEADGLARTLVVDLRLPRALLAACIGALLALSGCLAQGLFRNPLADPSLIGVTGGASLGGALVLVLGPTSLVSLWVSAGAFAGGLAAAGLVYFLARSVHGTSVATLLLAGVAITALAGALVNVLELAIDNQTLRRVSLWQQGSLAGASYGDTLLGAAGLVLLALLSWRLCGFLNAVLLGESEAGHLGFRVNRDKILLIAAVAAAMGLSVALAGAIAFVGLVVPHIVRLYAGSEHSRLLPRAALLGALVLVLADLIARLAMAPAEIPIGIVTALLGVPYFLFLLRRHQHRMLGA